MAFLVFWISAACIAYVYAGYPLLLMLWRTVPGRRAIGKRPFEPRVSLVVVMGNEKRYAARKIENCLRLDYPREKLQVIVSLDGPTDGTDRIAASFADRRVEIVHTGSHCGKAAALNAGVAKAQGEIVVFGDARQELETGALRELAANFADPSVGAVSGQLILLDSSGQEARDVVGIYWRYEEWLRGLESDIHSVVGATGAIYAIRRNLFEPLFPGTLLDDVVIPMRIAMSGKRVILDNSARAYDAATQYPEDEYSRKARTLTGNYQLLGVMPQVLSPFRNPIFVQTISHKAGRLLVPYGLLTLFLSNLFLLHGVYRFTLAMQLAWYAFAFAGFLFSRRCGAAHAKSEIEICQTGETA